MDFFNIHDKKERRRWFVEQLLQELEKPIEVGDVWKTERRK